MPFSHRFARALLTAPALAFLLLFALACHTPTPSTPAPPSPTAQQLKPKIIKFEADPKTVASRQTTTLRWEVENADELTINPDLGQVSNKDQRSIVPLQTTTYQLVVKNAAGSTQAAVTVAVEKPPTMTSQAEGGEARLRVANSQLRDVHFEYNGGDIREEDKVLLEQDATVLNDLFRLDPQTEVAVEGYCDDRGSDEYNMALGDRRASAVKQALIHLGVPEEKLYTLSFGKEGAVCGDASEDCYVRNRRVHFSASREKRADR